MRTSSQFVSLSIVLCLGLLHCDDTTTAQLPEPEGALVITRLTLRDALSRDVTVFTDTSLPDCSKLESQELPSCKNDVFMDRYAPHKSPPTPDGEMRVVFNKVPVFIGSQPIETTGGVLTPPGAIGLLCNGAGLPMSMSTCTSVPSLRQGLDVSGSGVSFDPTVVPYGPALWLRIDPTDVKAALEPDTAYRVMVSTELSGRDRQGIVLDGRAAGLLSFRTEPFRVLRVGQGDGKLDHYVYASDASGAGTGDRPYKVQSLALDGVLTLLMNAPVDDMTLSMAKLMAQVGSRMVPIKLGFARSVHDPVKMEMRCDLGRHRSVYIYPEAGAWGDASDKDAKVVVVLPRDTVRDVSQAMGHPVGAHSIGEVVITATLTGLLATDDKGYAGLRSTEVSSKADCSRM